MRRRRQPQDDLHNKERWLISYADFITLLFAFFVVMYSVSSVNEGKYKVLSETFTGVFNAPNAHCSRYQIGQPVRAPQQQHEDVNRRRLARRPVIRNWMPRVAPRLCEPWPTSLPWNSTN